ncbi:unnamed protein product [Caenorhabditis bovis]|uniref:Uncharacterized protein n=1 Tax=Caenorhabditis bovis TaxID=2654633 RepID=A0A8S1ETT9_9PELO|nr:unnamed protein product [Caenorhabditis bovis]
MSSPTVQKEPDLKMSQAVEDEIKEMCRTEYCKPDMDLIAQINELFPTEQSLTQLDAVIAAVEVEFKLKYFILQKIERKNDEVPRINE